MINENDTPIYKNLRINQIESNAKVSEPWYKKILTPTFRRWAYGVTAAALVAGATWAGKPEFIPVALPLVMAIFYVDKDGNAA